MANIENNIFVDEGCTDCPACGINWQNELYCKVAFLIQKSGVSNISTLSKSQAKEVGLSNISLNCPKGYQDIPETNSSEV
jgi:hypothetical protein